MGATVYRQHARRLRLQYGPGRPDIERSRPHKRLRDGRIVYLDSDEAPTLVTLTGEEVGLDVEALLRVGSIAPYTPPAPAPAPPAAARKGAPS